MKKVLLPVMFAVLLVILWTVPALALGVAMGPQSMEIEDALRGMEYERVVTVFNPSQPETEYSLRADGEAANWISFYAFESKEPIETVPVAGESSTYVLVKVKVPADITNGNYASTIYAESTSSEKIGDTGVSAVMQAKSELTIMVSGNQIIEGTVNSIRAYDTEAGMPLRLEVNFKNTGNVAVQPAIRCLINKENNKIAEFSEDKTTVKPELQENILVLWATAANQTGDYTGQVIVSLGDSILATQDIAFKIFPPGTFTKNGEMTSLNYVGVPAIDNMLKIQAGFKNTGEGDARAKLIAEVYEEGNLIDTIKSEETLVPVGQSGTVISYLKLTKPGSFVVKGLISYEGKQTATKELTIKVPSAGDGKDQTQPSPVSNDNLLWFVIIGVVGTAVLVFAGTRAIRWFRFH